MRNSETKIACVMANQSDISDDTYKRIIDCIADVSGVHEQSIKPDYKLGEDLEFDSIDRVEFIMMLEREFQVEVAESAITSQTTISELGALITTPQKEVLYYNYPRWAVTWPIRLLRIILQCFIFRLPSLFSCVVIRGRENLKHMNQPVIFIANHVSNYDAVYLVRALPRHMRKVAIAAAADYLYEIKPEFTWKQRLKILSRRFFSSLLLNAFPFSRDYHIKKSIVYLNQLVNRGWNILFFPEGKPTKTGEIASFKPGIDYLAQHLQIPVVPIKTEGLFSMVPYPRWIPKHLGRVTIIFGKPICMKNTLVPSERTQQYEIAMKQMS